VLGDAPIGPHDLYGNFAGFFVLVFLYFSFLVLNNITIHSHTGLTRVDFESECTQFFVAYANQHRGQTVNNVISKGKVGCPFRRIKQDFDGDIAQGFRV